MIFNYFESEKKLLYYDHSADEIPNEILAEYRDKDVTVVDFSANLLISLDCISQFSNLKEVILDNNFLSDITIFPKESIASISVLSLNNNKFENLEKLIHNLVNTFPNIALLSLLGNPLCPFLHQDFNDEDYKSYRLSIIKEMPKLKFLDASMIDKHELSQLNVNAKRSVDRRASVSEETSQRSGRPMEKFGKIRRFFGFIMRDPSPELSEVAIPEESYNPLPPESADDDSTKEKTAYGKLKYHYDGTNSQGNRFIANEDL